MSWIEYRMCVKSEVRASETGTGGWVLMYLAVDPGAIRSS